MILCRKCHIDYDRCECGTEGNINNTPFWVIMGASILAALSISGIIIWING